MEGKFKKIDKEFLLSDSSLNVYSYRLLTKGYLLSEFAKNPIGYFMHGKTNDSPREQGVLVKWDDLTIKGDAIYGKPCINLNHPRGQRTVDEIESGFLNAASFGQITVLEISDNPSDYLSGQEGITASKWFNRECSLVDIPGNYSALTELFDENNNPLKLEDLIAQSKFHTMEKIILNADQLQLMDLSADAKAEQVTSALQDLVAKAKKVDQLTTDLSAAKSEEANAKAELKTLKAAAVEKELTDLIAEGVKEGKITVEAGNKLKVGFAENPSGLKDLMATMPKYEGLAARIENNEKDAEVKDLMAKDWDALDKAGLLPKLKDLHLEGFKEKYKHKFSKDYQG